MARRRSGRKIDFTHWTYASFNAQALGAGQFGALFLPATHEPETWLRIRGSLLSFLPDTSAPDTLISVGIGLIPVPEGTGGTVTWSPITDGDAPWIWVSYFELAYHEKVTDVIAIQNAMAYREVIDNKAMRILRNQEVQCVIENVTIAGADALDCTMSGRVLSGT